MANRSRGARQGGAAPGQGQGRRRSGRGAAREEQHVGRGVGARLLPSQAEEGTHTGGRGKTERGRGDHRRRATAERRTRGEVGHGWRSGPTQLRRGEAPGGDGRNGGGDGERKRQTGAEGVPWPEAARTGEARGRAAGMRGRERRWGRRRREGALQRGERRAGAAPEGGEAALAASVPEQRRTGRSGASGAARQRGWPEAAQRGGAAGEPAAGRGGAKAGGAPAKGEGKRGAASGDGEKGRERREPGEKVAGVDLYGFGPEVGGDWQLVSSVPGELIQGFRKPYAVMTGLLAEREGVIRLILISNCRGAWDLVWLSYDPAGAEWRWVPVPDWGGVKGLNMAGIAVSSTFSRLWPPAPAICH